MTEYVESLYITISGKKLVCLWLYSSVMIVIYLSPLFLECPCISDLSLGPKPFIFAHRGLAEGAPENTNMSFTKALQVSDIRGVESDVTVRLVLQLLGGASRTKD